MANLQAPATITDCPAFPDTEAEPRLLPSRMPDNPQQYCSIFDEIRTMLAGSPYPAIRRLLWEFDGEVLVLEGTVTSYYLKQVVCSAIFKVAGIRRIMDRIEVRETTGEERTSG